MTIRFVYRKRPKIRNRTFGTFDIESWGLGGPYLDGATCTDGETVERHRTVEELWEALLDPPRPLKVNGMPSKRVFIWLAHNGAGFDFCYLAHLITKYAKKNGVVIETVQQGQKPIELIIPTPNGMVKLRDSYPFLDASLEAASKAYAPEYAKLGHCNQHNFTKLNSTEADYYDPTCSVCVGYLKGDVISLWHTYANARELVIKTFGIEPGLTAGSTAMRAWLYMIPRGHAYHRQAKDKEEFARRFTTGAFTYPGCTTELLIPEEGEEYAAITVDRSAAFAACQKEGGYPISTGIWTTEYTEEFYGLWECEAWCPVDCFPMVPLTKDGKKLWSTGAGTAYVTSEQYHACIREGYILKVTRGLVFEKTEDVFGAFIAKCEKLEYPEEGTADPAVKALAKRMRNSLNGKYNIRPEMERLYIGDPPMDSRPVIDMDTGAPLPLYTIKEETDAPYAQPVWYAITVSRQQLEEHRLRLLMPPDQTYKFDTDSATSSPAVIRHLIARGAIEMGNGYGTYKVEHNWVALQSIGPKNYMGIEDQGGKLVEVGNCKGIPVKTIKAHRDAQKRAANGEKVELQFDSTRTLVEMLRSSRTQPGIVRKRSISTPNSAEGWLWDSETKRFAPHHRDGP
jgi:DNA polymerase type B, organellar and viral